VSSSLVERSPAPARERSRRGGPEADHATPRRARAAIVTAVLAVALAIMAVVAAGTGQLAIPLDEVTGSLLHKIGLDFGPLPSHPQGENALWLVRFPRVVLAIIVGAALAGAGAVMQGVFGNPLAEPALVGVSSGAAVGASVVIVLGLEFAGSWTVALAAFATGLITTIAVYLLSRSNGRTEIVTLILTGVAVNAIAFATIAFCTFVADPQAREQIIFWQLGSLNGATWQGVYAVVPFAAVGLIAAVSLGRKLDVLALGERSARHLGVDVERLRVTAVVVIALLVGSGVAFTGIVGFVGLVVPHLLRMVVGPAHRVLITTSALAGALVLVTADLGARVLVRNADLPLGMLTALVGGPFFFWLLRRTRARQGGWA
jgi:iron complex transport system permease protein